MRSWPIRGKRNFTEDSPAPWLDSQTDTRKCILILSHLLRSGCKYSQLDYSRLSLALEKTTQHMRKSLEKSFKNTEQMVADMLLSETKSHVCQTAANILIMCMTIGARFQVQDSGGPAIIGNLEHVQERPNDMVDLYFKVDDGPSIIFGGRLECFPFLWAASPMRPRITILEDEFQLPPLWFLGRNLEIEDQHTDSCGNSDGSKQTLGSFSSTMDPLSKFTFF